MGTGKMEKEGKNNNKHLDLLIHNILGHHKAHTNFEDPGSNRNFNICHKKICKRERKMIKYRKR